MLILSQVNRPPRNCANPIPPRAGIGLQHHHYRAFVQLDRGARRSYLGGGKPLAFLKAAHEHYPLRPHDVGLSLGTANRHEGEIPFLALDTAPFAQVRALVDRQPLQAACKAATTMDRNLKLIAGPCAHLTRGTFSDFLVSDKTAGAVP